ncbi:SgcJ/EcaC family oxidoreductase [Paractinoplanes rishiriensis]|uniref:DUF4440 domain-containing protein n=1 Tax=Paractinoplanes rishiriensis TaxID=1050105 RepID=A0A919MZV5_9ACTN|nr:SgcJ/EcaC family oxidoreductase [Actinoplanes rishiriensis]GIE98810.1 hypothetical protein Ari01nite_62750 [Actinoplanes rishiriensis]
MITDGGLGGAAARELYQQLLDAWNKRRADDFAALFAADALLVGFDGSQIPGNRVAEHLRPIFADHPTAKYVAKVRQLRPLGSDTTMLIAIAGMAPPGGTVLNPSANAVQTLLVEPSGNTWRIVLFQNTPAQYHGHPEVAAQHTAELQPFMTAGVLVA